MNPTLDHDAITQTLADCANTVPVGDAPLDVITRRGRSRNRGRTAIGGVAVALVLMSGVLGTLALLKPRDGQLAVTESSVSAAAPSATTDITSTPAPDDGQPAAAVEATSVTTMPGGYDAALAYQDGFLLVDRPSGDESGLSATTTLAFSFTTDGAAITPLGSELVVEGWASAPAVDSDTIAVASITGGSEPELHVYWTEDLEQWTEETYPLVGPGRVPKIPATLDGLVAIEPYWSGGFEINGERWVAPITVVYEASDELVRRHHPTGHADGKLIADGLWMVDAANLTTTVPLEELGLTAADGVFPDSIYGHFTLLSGQRGQSELGVGGWPVGPSPRFEPDLVPFGEGFANIADDWLVMASKNGADWAPLDIEVPTEETYTALSSLGDDLLVLTASPGRVAAYRRSAAGATTFLGDVPVADWSELRAPGSMVGHGVFTTMGFGNPNAARTTLTANYEITLQERGGVEHFAIRDRSTGDLVAEGDGKPVAETVDGVAVLIYVDSLGRPDVAIPETELRAGSPVPTTGGAPSGSVPSVADEADSAAAAADGFRRMIATADGVHWYQSPNGSREEFYAVNGDRLLVSDVAAHALKVVDLGAAAR